MENKNMFQGSHQDFKERQHPKTQQGCETLRKEKWVSSEFEKNSLFSVKTEVPKKESHTTKSYYVYLITCVHPESPQKFYIGSHGCNVQPIHDKNY